MNKTRLEAFSDGVLAIIVTIMVLELKIPEGVDFESLRDVAPKFISYMLSFIFICIYWGNHHHLLHTVHHVTSKIIWSNMHLLFWLSLIPFATGWVGDHPAEHVPVAIYSSLMLLCGFAYFILQKSIESHYTHSTNLITALKRLDRKGIMSQILYTISIIMAFFYPRISEIIILIVAIMWVIPDKNIEKALRD